MMASSKTSPKLIVQSDFKIFPLSLKNFKPFSMIEKLSLLKWDNLKFWMHKPWSFPYKLN